MTMIRKLFSVWMLMLVVSFLLPLESLSAVSGTTYDASSVTMTAPATIVECMALVTTAEYDKTGLRSKATGQLKSLFGFHLLLTAPKKGGLNLYKWGDKTSTRATGWKEGDRFLHLPDKGSPKANWKQNAGRLREEMNKGNPIYD